MHRKQIGYRTTSIFLLLSDLVYIFNGFVHRLKTSLTLCFGCVGCDVIEDVDKDKEEGDEEGHPAGDNLRRNEE